MLLQQEIEKLSACYPRYGYRRITELLLRMGYTVGYRRVARLMKSVNQLEVPVKPRNPLIVSVNGATDLITLTFVGGIKSGLQMLLMFGSKDTLSMFQFSWMYLPV